MSVEERSESLLDVPAFDFLDLVTPLVSGQKRVKGVEHLRVIPFFTRHRIDIKKRQVSADAPIALLKKELDDRIEPDHDRMRNQLQHTRRHPISLTERDEIAGEVRHPPFRPFPV